MESDSDELWQCVERKVLIRGDGGSCAGKGLVLVGRLLPGTMESFVDVELTRSRKWIELEITIATLLYVAGYF